MHGYFSAIRMKRYVRHAVYATYAIRELSVMVASHWLRIDYSCFTVTGCFAAVAIRFMFI